MKDTAITETHAADAVPLRTAAAPSEEASTWTEDTVPLRLGVERAEEEERAERLRLLVGQRTARRR